MTKKRFKDFRFKKNKTRSGWAGKPKSGVPPARRLLIFLSTSASVGLLVGVVIFSIYKWLTVAEFFQITSIRVEGLRRLDKQQIAALSGVTIRTNLLAMDVHDVVTKIEAHDWVQKANIKRDLPSDLVVTVQERQPVALINTRKGLFYVDKMGVIFAAANPPEDLDYPIITGLEAEVSVPLEHTETGFQENNGVLKNALLFIQYAKGGSSSLPRQNISEIYVTEKQEYILFLADHPFPIYLGSEAGSKRYHRLAKVLYWLYKKREFSDVNFIRMDYMNDKVLVGKKEAS